MELRRMLGVSLLAYKYPMPQEYLPHLTLSYNEQFVPMRAIEPITCMVEEFCLIHSELWLTKYQILRRWRLPGDCPPTAPVTVPTPPASVIASIQLPMRLPSPPTAILLPSRQGRPRKTAFGSPLPDILASRAVLEGFTRRSACARPSA